MSSRENVKMGSCTQLEPSPKHNTSCKDRKKEVQCKPIDLLRVARPRNQCKQAPR